MGLDMRRMAAAALEAAFEDETPQERPKTRHPAVRAVAAGVVLGGAARIALARTSTIRQVGGALKMANRLREAPERLRENFADRFEDLRERVGGVEFGEGGPDEEGPEADLEPDEELEEPQDLDEPTDQAEGEGAEEAEAEAPAESEAEAPQESEAEEEESDAEEPEEAEATGEAEAEEPEASGEEPVDQGEREDEAEEPQASEDEDAGDTGSNTPDVLSLLQDENEGDTGSDTPDVLSLLRDEDSGDTGSNTPDVVSVLSAAREPPPVLSRLGGKRREAPTRRPPVPSETGSRGRSKSRERASTRK